MKLDDFNNIDFKNAGSLPLPVKAVLLAFIVLFIIGAGYWFVWSSSIDELDQAKAKEAELRQVFLSKKKEAINLEAYKKQMVDIQKTFGTLLRQLPDKSQMDGLLSDISVAGKAKGLEFELFKPGQEIIGDYYAELPISIKVIGSYDAMGGFATDISKLSRIVTINDIYVTELNKDKEGKPGKDNKSGVLVMEAVAKTYRFLDPNEIAAKKKADKKVPSQG